MVREVFVGLSNYASHPREGTLAAVYQRLSSDTRAILDQRAKSASELGGREVKAWELLSFSKLVTGDRVTKISVLDEQGDRARVEVKFGWLMPSEEGAERLLPEPVQVDVVREDGAWRVTLPLADSSVKVEDAPPTSP